MEKTVKIDWRRKTVRDVCTRCIYYDVCGANLDCEALKAMVKIYENLDYGNPDF